LGFYICLINETLHAEDALLEILWFKNQQLKNGAYQQIKFTRQLNFAGSLFVFSKQSLV